jgi:flavin-dependent thymidylate synthase
MKVVLAGYNVDREALDEVRRAAPNRLDLTPETLSASYARISRDSRPVDELRRAARAEVDRARRSNRTIIFKMGHHSVAEHAVFNFDVMGVSRLAIEEIEKFRLVSCTEKSQRYITLGSDFVVPEEIVKAGRRDVFIETVKAQSALYHSLYERLRPFVFAQNAVLAADPGKKGLLEGWAKEDARYAVSLATEGQLGLTVNARNLELMIRRFAARPLAEVRELNGHLYDLARGIAPSIILFTAATDFDAKAYGDIGETIGSAFRPPAKKTGSGRSGPKTGADVRLIDCTADGDDRILAALAHTTSGRPYDECLRGARALSGAARRAVFLRAFERMEFYDFPLREFEYADLTYELVLSASAFAQLKRHRMATLTTQPYDPDLGVTVPPSVEAIGAGPEFRSMIERTNAVHADLRRTAGEAAAAYVLTNAHRRRALIKVNLRELYHIARLRQDFAAQWDIRALAAAMTGPARKVMPLAGLLLGGKDAYPALYRKAFGRPPKLFPPDITK